MSLFCKQCKSSLEKDPFSGRMVCHECGSSWLPEEVEYSEQVLNEEELDSALEDYVDTDEELINEFFDCRFFTCSACGNEVYVNGGEAPTECVFCGKQTLTYSRTSKVARPEYLLPFAITEDQAVRAIRKRFKRGFFISHKLKHFKSNNIRKMYIPYWLVNGNHIESDTFSGTKIEHERSGVNMFDWAHVSSHGYSLGRYHAGETFVGSRRYGRAGKVRFSNLPVDALANLSDYCSAHLAPFDLSSIKEFDEHDVEGIYTCEADISNKELVESVQFRTGKAFQEEAMDSFSAGNKTIVKKNSSTFVDHYVHAILMPVYFTSFNENGQRRSIMVNGQSGKVVYAAHFKKGAFVAVAALLSTLLAFPLGCGLRFIRTKAMGLPNSVYDDIFDLFERRAYSRSYRFAWENMSGLSGLCTFLYALGLVGLIALLIFSIKRYKKTVSKLQIDESSTMSIFIKKKRK